MCRDAILLTSSTQRRNVAVVVAEDPEPLAGALVIADEAWPSRHSCPCPVVVAAFEAARRRVAAVDQTQVAAARVTAAVRLHVPPQSHDVGVAIGKAWPATCHPRRHGQR